MTTTAATTTTFPPAMAELKTEPAPSNLWHNYGSPVHMPTARFNPTMEPGLPNPPAAPPQQPARPRNSSHSMEQPPYPYNRFPQEEPEPYESRSVNLQRCRLNYSPVVHDESVRIMNEVEYRAPGIPLIEYVLVRNVLERTGQQDFRVSMLYVATHSHFLKLPNGEDTFWQNPHETKGLQPI